MHTYISAPSTLHTYLKPTGCPCRRLVYKILGCFQPGKKDQTYAYIQRRGAPAKPPDRICWHRPRMGTFFQMLISIYQTSSARIEKVSLASANWELTMAKKNLSVALTILLQQAMRQFSITPSPSPPVLHQGTPSILCAASTAQSSTAVPHYVLLFTGMNV